MHNRYKDRAAFLGVYVREAHAADGWWPQPEGAPACDVRQPKTFFERQEVAGRCSQALKMTMPLLVDEIDDRVGHAYSGMPDRLYVIGRDGKVLYKGGRGPFGFRPGEMEQHLALHLLEQRPQGKGGQEAPRPGNASSRGVGQPGAAARNKE